MIRLAAAALAAAFACPAAAAERLTVATWNMEWMMRPRVFDALAAKCFGRGSRPGGDERSIPCDLAPKGRWSEEDLARLRAFAATLPADVVALQEIDGVDAAREIFPDHAFCFTKRRHVQNVGFAIRRGVRHRCNRDHEALGLPEDTVRWGADVTIEPGTPREMRLLAVHLKASCNRDPLTAGSDDCRLLQRQVPVLEDWIDRRARANEAFGVIGDFNRRFDREREAARDDDGRDRRDLAGDRRRRSGRQRPREPGRRARGGRLRQRAWRAHADRLPYSWQAARRPAAAGLLPGVGLPGRRPLARSLRDLDRARAGGLFQMAYDKDNIFARIVRGEIPCHKVYEDAETLAFMDIMPQAEGHTLVVPKAAGEDLFTTPPESVAAAIRTTQKVARAIKKAFSPPGVMIAQLNGPAAGQSVFHLHFHVIPRYVGKDLSIHAADPAEPAALAAHAARIRAAL